MKQALPSSALLALILLTAGCDVVPPAQPDFTRYYVLTGPALSEGPVTGRLQIGMRRIELSSYLDTRDIVVRDGTNEIAPQDFSRWGEPLAAGVARILRLQLEADPQIGRVYSQPFPFESKRDYDLAITIVHCEGVVERGLAGRSSVRFAAVIEVTTPGPEARVVARRTFVAPDAPWDGRDYSKLAALLSEDVSALGRDVIGTLPEPPK